MRIKAAGIFEVVKLIILEMYESFEGVDFGLYCSLLYALRSLIDSRAFSRDIPCFVLCNTVTLSHDEKGTLFDFIVNAGKVFAENTDGDQLDSAQEKNQGHERGEPGLSGFKPCEPFDHKDASQEKPGRADESSKEGHEFEGLVGKAEDRVQGILDQAFERLFGFAPCPLLSIIIDDALFKPDPTSETREKSIFFCELFQLFQGLLVDQTKDACLGRDRKVADPLEDPVKRFKPKPSKAAFLSTPSLGTDDLSTSPPAHKEIGDHLGGVLQIPIHENRRHPRRHASALR